MAAKLNLNHNQEIAVNHTDGPMMVLAGPGSGKTAVITARASELIHTHGVEPRRILVITYSKAAATEMQRRFIALEAGMSRRGQATHKVSDNTDSAHSTSKYQAYEGDTPLATSIHPEDEGEATLPSSPIFGTFHSVFYRMLRQSKRYEGNTEWGQLFHEGERRMVVRRILSEMEYAPDGDFLSAVLSEMSLIKNELYDLTRYQSTTIGEDDFRRLFLMYESHKAEKNKIDFDDMLTLTYTMLKDDAAMLARWQRVFKYIMIDEFQDINRAQYETIKLMAAPANNLFIVGDDDQSIYRFRGSRPEFLLNFPQDYKATRRVTLDINYRSTNQIINYANGIIVENQLRYDKEIKGTGRDGKKPLILVYEDQNQEADNIAQRIREMWKKGVDLDNIAVIYRLNLQARAFADAFMSANIPFRNRDETPVLYDHWIAADFFAYLRVAIRLYKKQKTGYDTDAERIINKPYRYIGKAFMQGMKKTNSDLFRAYRRDPILHTASKTKIEELKADLLAVAKRDSASAIKYIRQVMGYDNHISDHCAYRKIKSTGLFEIADELQEAAKGFLDLELFLAHGRASIAAAKDPDANHGPCCSLTTLHSAKGLEYDSVFIAGVVEDVIPYVRSKTDADIEEERRLLYVGVTRARHELYISTIKTRYDKKVEPSRFLGFNRGV